MKKQLLIAGLAGLFLSASAGDGGTGRYVRTLRKFSAPIKAPQFHAVPAENSASRADRSLTKMAIASSGNLYSVVRSTSNCLDADDSLGAGAVTFTFRTDTMVFHGSNSSRYRFVLSTDGGTSWGTPSKELNKNVVYANSGVNARYPQGLLYRPAGVTIADSAYVVYSGTWHNGSAGIWSGESRGVGKLNNDSTTFTEHDPNINNELNIGVLISSSLTKAGNKFYNTTEISYSTNYAAVNGFVLMSGKWNPTTKDVDWTDQTVPLSFEVYPNSQQSIYGTQAIAFDPTGQIGYWVATGDINPNDGIIEMKPFFAKSVDGGQTWSNFETIALDSISSFQRPPMMLNPNGSGDSVATTINVESVIDVAVDYLGNPHIGIVAALSSYNDGTNNPNYGYQLFDLTTGTNLCDNNGWIANYIKPMHSLNSLFSNIVDGTSPTGLNDNYRLQASRSQDGKYIFFLWVETDSTIAAQYGTDADNNSPDLLGIGIDVEHAKTTTIKNFTADDPMFGGQTPSFAGGSVGGALFALVSQTTLSTASEFIVPVTVSQADYLNPSAIAKSGENPAKHWYLQNITFARSEFTHEGADHDPPILSGVLDTIIIHVDSSITAVLPTNVTAFDCHDGDVTNNISVNTSGVDTAVAGTYTLSYSVNDSAGNVRTETTTVLVEAAPIAKIGANRLAGDRYTFIDSSLNLPTSRAWRFSNTTQVNTTPQVTKTFGVSGSINVCLTVWNNFGTDSTCRPFDVVVGIQNVEMNNSISVYPTTTSGQITIEVNKTIDEDMTVTPYSLSGAAVASDLIVKRNTASTTINLSNLASGVYQLKIGNEKDGYAVKPVIIQK